ncbi:hypothetical protein BX600DRAFT_439056 [Xylariales sp. PMI_506]|nr:hypothetical protein BX600DRAFT_439056 [Xylariales sp. PMI_506]
MLIAPFAGWAVENGDVALLTAHTHTRHILVYHDVVDVAPRTQHAAELVENIVTAKVAGERGGIGMQGAGATALGSSSNMLTSISYTAHAQVTGQPRSSGRYSPRPWGGVKTTPRPAGDLRWILPGRRPLLSLMSTMMDHGLMSGLDPQGVVQCLQTSPLAQSP